MKWINLEGFGWFAFDYVSNNKYIITFIEYEKHFICEDCNINVPKNFIITNDYCIKTLIIKTINNPGYNTFCLAPHNNITDFYINETYINEKYYMGRTFEFIMNNEIDKINMKNPLIISLILFLHSFKKFFFSLYIYYMTNISCGNDYPEYINSSEGKLPPKNTNTLFNADTN